MSIATGLIVGAKTCTRTKATRYVEPATTKTDTYDPVHCRMYPTALAANIVPTDPAMLANPTALPAAVRGNMSDASVYIFADQLW